MAAGPDPAAIEVQGTHVGTDCRQIGRKVAVPEWPEGARAKSVLAETAVALKTANDRIEAGDRCQEKQADGLANPFPKPVR